MAFTSPTFVCFLAAVLVATAVVPRRFAWVVLLLASYGSYAAYDWAGAALLAFQACTVYAAALLIASGGVGARRLGLWVGLLPTLATLLFLKYAGFVCSAVSQVLALFPGVTWRPTAPHLPAPIGLSFFTFAYVGYLLDVWRCTVPAERNLGRVALFGAFFPQIVSGPIPRAGQLLPQLRRPAAIDEERLWSGGMLILWGLFKKLVIADRLATYVDPVYANVHAWNAATLTLASYFYAFQIYCDFAGYTDIATGAARALGIDLMLNFRQPYFSRSVGEFWHRWHVSLSTWFRDYLYIPLGGSRVSARRWVVNVMVVFLVSGLWHGAAWTFLVWGGMHGACLVVERLTSPARDRLWRRRSVAWVRPAVSRVVTFHAVLLAWVFFRASSVRDAVHVIGQLPRCLQGRAWQGDSQLTTALSLGLIIVLLIVEAIQSAGAAGAIGRMTARGAVAAPAWPLRWIAGAAMLLGIFLLGVSSSGFIYGKF